MRNLLLMLLVGVLAFSCRPDPPDPDDFDTPDRNIATAEAPSLSELTAAFKCGAKLELVRSLPKGKSVRYLGKKFTGQVVLPVDTLRKDSVLYIAGPAREDWLTWLIFAGLPAGSVGASFQQTPGKYAYESQFWHWENAQVGANEPFRILLDDGSVLTARVAKRCPTP